MTFNVHENGIDRPATAEEIQAREEFIKSLLPIPPTAKERLDKMEPTLAVVQKAVADLGNLIGKLMRGGLK